MFFNLSLPVLFIISLSLLLFFFWLGSFVKSHLSVEKSDSRPSTFTVEATLLSLLIGFTFSMAASKYDKRKEIFNEEINRISKVVMLAQIYPDSIRHEVIGSMTDYIFYRIRYYDAVKDETQIIKNLNSTDSISRIIYRKIINYAKNPDYRFNTQLIIPAYVEMMQSIQTREIYRNSPVPLSVLRFLLVLSLLVSFMNGYNQSKDTVKWSQAIGFAVLISLSFLLIIDFYSQRKGLIEFSIEQNHLINLKKQVNNLKINF